MPEFLKQGIGGELIREGLKACRQPGYDSVIVLGILSTTRSSGSNRLTGEE
jgi:predicted N-acetyltransferase YhbS